MGCDIHLHTEINVDGVWHHYSAPSIDRDYELFAKMAGVRNYNNTTPISLLRGLPDGISLVTALSAEHWDGDGHSHSWLNSAEIGELVEWLGNRNADDGLFVENRYWGYLFGNSFEGVLKYKNSYPDGVLDARFIFWFDN